MLECLHLILEMSRVVVEVGRLVQHFVSQSGDLINLTSEVAEPVIYFLERSGRTGFSWHVAFPDCRQGRGRVGLSQL